MANMAITESVLQHEFSVLRVTNYRTAGPIDQMHYRIDPSLFRSIAPWILSAMVAVAANANGQTVNPSGPSPSTNIGSGGSSQSGVTPNLPIGATIGTSSPAVPAPNPNLTSNATLPDRRGFVRAEPFFVYPWIGLGAGHNSNLTGTSNNPISTNFLVVSPKVDAQVRSGSHLHSLSYTGNYGRYFSSSADNYNDHELVARTSNQFTARADLNGTMFYIDRVDPRGSLARAQSNEPDHYTAIGGNAIFGYGAMNAQGRVEGELGFTDKNYSNNRIITQSLDVATLTMSGRFFYRVAPRTRVLSELRITEYDYKTSNRDNQELRYLVGATWDLAAATSGTIKFGWMTKTFKDSGLQDFSGATIEGAVRWVPLTYSTIDLVAKHGAVDSAGTGVYTVDTNLGVMWSHRWNSFLSTRSALTYTESDFRGITRTDKATVAQLGIFSDVKTWLRLGLDYQMSQRRSSDSNAEFDRRMIMVTLGATI